MMIGRDIDERARPQDRRGRRGLSVTVRDCGEARYSTASDLTVRAGRDCRRRRPRRLRPKRAAARDLRRRSYRRRRNDAARLALRAALADRGRRPRASDSCPRIASSRGSCRASRSVAISRCPNYELVSNFGFWLDRGRRARSCDRDGERPEDRAACSRLARQSPERRQSAEGRSRQMARAAAEAAA